MRTSTRGNGRLEQTPKTASFRSTNNDVTYIRFGARGAAGRERGSSRSSKLGTRRDCSLLGFSMPVLPAVLSSFSRTADERHRGSHDKSPVQEFSFKYPLKRADCASGGHGGEGAGE